MTAGTFRGPVLFSYAFRPFFLAAALWAVVDVAVWMGLFAHGGALPSRFDTLSWHIHEMLFGFVMAAIAGFLLTAVANWTGRPPVRGMLLAVLVLLWALGRLACWYSALIPAPLAILADLALPLLLAAVVAREVVAARNWRNIVMVAPVLVLAGANLLMYCEAIGGPVAAGLGWRLGVAAILVLISAIGGRIIPAFTRNWLAKTGQPGPAPHGAVDRLALATLHIALLLWAFFPDFSGSGAMLLLAALFNGWRLSRWRGGKTCAEPMLLILHVGYGWLVFGVALLGLVASGWPLPIAVPVSAALHSLTAGTIGTMILAVMTRVSRGHTGRALTADTVTVIIYLLISAAAVTRVLAAFGIWNIALLMVAALLWAGAFLLFLVAYGPLLLQPRADTK